MECKPLGEQEIRRQRVKVALAHRDHAFRPRRDDGPDNLRPRPLIGLVELAAVDLGDARLRRGDLETISRKVDVVRRIACPDREDDVDSIGEQLVAVVVEQAEGLGVRAQRARADAEDEPAARQMVEHGSMRSDQRGVRVRKVRGPGGELDALGGVHQRGEEDEAVGDVLGLLGEVLADERVVEAELVGEDDHRLAVLLERLRRRTLCRVQRHGEIAKSHGRNYVTGGLLRWPREEIN